MKNFLFKRSKDSVKAYRMSQFNFVWAALVMVAAGGVGVWTLKGSFADNSGIVRVRAYSVEGSSQTPLAGVKGQAYSINPCNGQPLNIQFTTYDGGEYTYPYSTNCGASDAIFCFALESVNKSGYTALSASVDTGNANTGSTGICGSIPSPGGYVGFAVLLAPNPVLEMSTNTASITKGDSAVLSWSSTHTTSCTATAGGINISGAKSGSQTVKPTQTTTYTIRCEKSGTPSVTKSVTITVTAASTPSSSTKKPPTSATTPTIDVAPPSVPANVNATFLTDSSAYISWSPSTDSSGIASYIIERSTDKTTWEVAVKDVITAFYEDSSVSDDNTYYYRVSAKDTASNQSSASDVAELEAAATEDADTSTSGTEKTTTNAAKKSGTGKTLGAVGIVVLLSAAGLGLWWYRRRQGGSYDDYNQFAQPIQPVPPSPPSAMHTPAPPIEPPAPHTSKSLKDMVLEDLQNEKQHPHKPE